MLSQVDPTESLHYSHYCHPADNRTTQAVLLRRTQFYTFACSLNSYKSENALLSICSFYT